MANRQGAPLAYLRAVLERLIEDEALAICARDCNAAWRDEDVAWLEEHLADLLALEAYLSVMEAALAHPIVAADLHRVFGRVRVSS